MKHALFQPHPSKYNTYLSLWYLELLMDESAARHPPDPLRPDVQAQEVSLDTTGRPPGQLPQGNSTGRTREK